MHHCLDDVLKARLKTVGVSEYKFEMETSIGRETGTEWKIVDVGGSRSQVRRSFIRSSLVHSPCALVLNLSFSLL